MTTREPVVYTLDDFDDEIIPYPLWDIFRRLTEGGHDALLVGGCLRDYLVGRTPKDFDTVTDAHPTRIRELVPKSKIIGRRFLLVHAKRRGTKFEIATYRKDPSAVQKQRAAARGHKAQNVYGNQAEDAIRRDFTANALYFDPIEHEILDYVNGFEDLRNRVLRSIRNPYESFAEDPVRMLRAARFAAKLDFTIDPGDVEAIAANKELLQNVSPARMRDELSKMFLTGHGEASLAKMQELDLLSEVLPNLTADADDLIEQAMIESDARYEGGHKLSTAYLIAVFLWHDYVETFEIMRGEADGQLTLGQISADACHTVIRRAREYVAINRESTDFIVGIFRLQYALETKRSVRRVLQNRYIRAGVHLYSIRALVGDADPETAAFWQECQPSREEAQRRRHAARMSKSSQRRDRRRRYRQPDHNRFADD
ncbi:MAG: polynucleotide adenylyltransferase PcnB [Gammaproteobacteria bacterium]|nr:polynucleotide adenylyltransferase PcnB [Gammaproteobacteria bacterium]